MPPRKKALSPQEKLERVRLLEKQQLLKNNLPHLYGRPFYPWMRKYFDSRNKVNIVCSANQIGKMLDLDTQIPTPAGFKKMRDIEVGDYVFSMDGNPTEVIAIPYIGTETAYKVLFNDGSSVICGGNHDWICKSPVERFRKEYGNSSNKAYRLKNKNYLQWQVKSTNEIVERGKYSPDTPPPKRYSIPVSAPVNFKNAELPDPYFVGIFIGNGFGEVITMNAEDTDVVGRLYKVGCGKRSGKQGSIVVSVSSFLKSKFPLLDFYRNSYEKRIPEDYLFSSIEQRTQLLNGLMDSDGYCSQNGQHSSYSTTSQELANQVLFLMESLGGIAYIKKKTSAYKKDGIRIKCRDHFVVVAWFNFNPFWSKRKSGRWKKNDRYSHERVIVSIEKLPPRKMKCITVADKSGSFLCTERFIVTHNSSVQIRKCIEWATNKALWPELWPHHTPRQFWYLYPSSYVATVEFEKKWQPEFMPQDGLKKHPIYGWSVDYRANYIQAVHFNAGVSVYMKTYSQDPQDLQSGSVSAIFCDEEPQAEILPELQARLFATDGYMHFVFTPTLGQEFWREAIEVKGQRERFPDALKIQVSMFDCMEYEDGSKSFWTQERIQKIINSCKSEAEVQRRVYGKFVLDSGLKYQAFDPSINIIEPKEIPHNWPVYIGVDAGSGGKFNHPAAYCFVAMRPDYQLGYVFKGKRFDGETTTNADIVAAVMDAKRDLINPVMGIFYDYSATDLRAIAYQTANETWIPAEKSHLIGEQYLNVAFRNKMLFIFDLPELEPIVSEIKSLKSSTPKNQAKDDAVDSCRYAVSRIPWDWSCIPTSRPEAKKPKLITDLDRRKEFVTMEDFTDYESIEQELEAWAELYEY